MRVGDIRARRWMIDRARLTGARLLVAAVVLGECERGEARLSIAQLEVATGMSRSTVRKALARLIEDGIIERRSAPSCGRGMAATWAPGRAAKKYIEGR